MVPMSVQKAFQNLAVDCGPLSETVKQNVSGDAMEYNYVSDE